MEKLKGPDSIAVVTSRFSDGCDVVRCVLDFYEGMAEIESTYAASVTRLLKSTSYTFHSNILMQWLGNEPFEELGTVKNGWQKLGSELCKLAEHHAEKAEGYSNLLRQPLSDLLPRLEGMRKTIRTRGRELVNEVDHCTRKLKAEKQNYMKCGNRYEKLLLRIEANPANPAVAESKYAKQQEELRKMSDALKHQEALYQSSAYELSATQKMFNKELSSLYKSAEQIELERVNALGTSLQDFSKILSNTAPSYLECMQRIVFSVADIDGQKDINSFVDDHKQLMVEVESYQFEPHPCRRLAYPSGMTTYSGNSATEADITAAGGIATSENLSSNEATKQLSGELLMPVENHFEGDNGNESAVTLEANDEHSTVASKGDKIKAFTKKLKFWSRITPDRSSDSGTENEVANSDMHRSHDQTTPKSVGDEIEAILSTPKRTKRTSIQKQPVDETTVVTPLEQSSPEVQPLLVETTNKKEPLAAPIETSSQEVQARPDVKQSAGDREMKQISRESLPADGRTAPLPVKQKPMVAVKPKLVAKPQAHIAPIQKEEPLTTAELLLRQLEHKAEQNDYYQLLGIEQSASTEEIARRRRERSRELHPDHFMTDSAQKTKAEEELVLINQVYTDVLNKEKSRELYNQLCKFRKFYKQILTQKEARLQNAKERMGTLRDSLRKAKTPLSLQEEVDLALKLIELHLKPAS